LIETPYSTIIKALTALVCLSPDEMESSFETILMFASMHLYLIRFETVVTLEDSATFLRLGGIFF